MCGIVGYVGWRDAADVLMQGLSRLEYRGYDSAGIAVFQNDIIKVAKSKGRLADLQAKMDNDGKPLGHSGIGHTRWATHGEPSDRNSHPHGDGNVTLVHNGIIENYKKLKEFLLSQGRSFKSDTDTEVVAQLIDYYYELNHGNPIDAIIKTLQEVEGSYALGVIFSDFPDRVFALRKESPLIVGIGENESFIASDVTAILQYTRKYYLLDPGEIAVLSRKGAKVYDMHYQKIEKELKIADWDVSVRPKKAGIRIL